MALSNKSSLCPGPGQSFLRNKIMFTLSLTAIKFLKKSQTISYICLTLHLLKLIVQLKTLNHDPQYDLV